jgi:hypothetical protein
VVAVAVVKEAEEEEQEATNTTPHLPSQPKHTQSLWVLLLLVAPGPLCREQSERIRFLVQSQQRVVVEVVAEEQTAVLVSVVTVPTAEEVADMREV